VASARVEGSGVEPKQDRSRVTRRRLLDGCVTCLAERGWNATTVGEVAARAGVSRGAAQHHFPTREDLINATLEDMFERMDQRIAELASASTGRERTDETVAAVLEFYTGPEFKAALHIWTAAAADPALREAMLPLEAGLGRAAHGAVVRLLGVDDRDPVVRGLVQATLDLGRGLGLADLLHDDSRRRAHISAAWSSLLHSALGSG
jgi:AcrR family transcriptional regulator